MVITIEPGIYIPEEKIGVRIEDDVLITATGYVLLTQRLPRSADEVEKVMAEGKRARAAKENVSAGAVASAPSQNR
jgi:Xaa-Pro aminopeptidase